MWCPKNDQFLSKNSCWKYYLSLFSLSSLSPWLIVVKVLLLLLECVWLSEGCPGKELGFCFKSGQCLHRIQRLQIYVWIDAKPEVHWDVGFLGSTNWMSIGEKRNPPLVDVAWTVINRKDGQVLMGCKTWSAVDFHSAGWLLMVLFLAAQDEH